MKYTIEGFSQQFASTLKKKTIKNNKEVEIKIDCTDLVILRWFVDFYPNMKKMVVDGKEYAWLTHKKLMEDLPLIDISRAGFIARMQKLVEFNVLQYKFVKEGGSFSLYTFGDNYYNLISNGGVCSNTHGVDAQTYTGVHTQTYTKDNNIIDKSIKDIKENTKEKEIFDYWNSKKIIEHEKIDDHLKAIKDALKENTVEQVKTYIDRYAKVIKDTSWYFNTKWRLVEFLKQKNAMNDFKDDGSKWLNYKNRRKDPKVLHEQEYTQQDYDNVFNTFKNYKIL